MSEFFFKFKNLHWTLIFLICSLSSVGIIMIFSASRTEGMNATYSQISKLIFAFFIMLTVSMIDIRTWQKYSILLYLFGVAILIEAITDNKNRTVADIRHALSKFGGSLGQAGSVSWNFERNGIILIDKNEISENEIFEFSIENDCIEFFEDKECYRLHFNSNDLYNKLDILEKLSINVDSSFLAYVPKDEIDLSEDENQKVEKLLEFLDDLEDVQNVFSNQSIGKS